MKETLKANLHNRFDIEVRDAFTGELKQRAYAENIILDQAWATIISTAGSWFTKIYVGTGTGTLAATRNALFIPLTSKDVNTAVWGGAPKDGYYSLRRSITLLETEFVGVILTELGVGNSILCTHAMLKDMNGNQVALTKTNVDIITIYATIYLKFAVPTPTDAISLIPYKAGVNPLADLLLGCTIGTQSHYYDGTISLPLYINVSTEDTHSPTTVVYNAAMTRTLDVANKRISYYHRIPAASANVGGLRSLFLSSLSGSNNNFFTHVIARLKDAVLTQAPVVEQIGTGNGVLTAFATTFPFVKSGAVIKVDGTVVSPTVLTGLPKVKNMKGHMYNLGVDGNYNLLPGSNIAWDAGNDAYPVGSNLDPLVLENPFYAAYGIDSIKVSYATLFTSDDMVTWTQVYTTTAANSIYTVAADQKQKRYWKFQMSGTTPWTAVEININAFGALKNVIFAAAPAVGAAITAEYTPNVASKDVNHALDVNIVLQMGEYIP